MDKALLLQGVDLPEDEVEIPGVGTVRVRALTRAQALLVGKVNGVAETEALVLQLGIVDPVLTSAEVRQWMDVALAGVVEPVSKRIAELSGMLEGSVKAAYKSDGDRSEPGV